jgi:hypothetical protein
VRRFVFLRWEVGRNARERKQQENNRILMDCTRLLTYIVSQAGEKLSALMQADSKVLLYHCIAAPFSLFKCL